MKLLKISVEEVWYWVDKIFFKKKHHFWLCSIWVTTSPISQCIWKWETKILNRISFLMHKSNKLQWGSIINGFYGVFIPSIKVIFFKTFVLTKQFRESYHSSNQERFLLRRSSFGLNFCDVYALLISKTSFEPLKFIHRRENNDMDPQQFHPSCHNRPILNKKRIAKTNSKMDQDWSRMLFHRTLAAINYGKLSFIEVSS